MKKQYLFLAVSIVGLLAIIYTVYIRTLPVSPVSTQTENSELLPTEAVSMPEVTPMPPAITAELTVAPGEIVVGQQFTVYLSIDSGTVQVSNGDFHISYPVNLLRLESIDAGSFFPNPIVFHSDTGTTSGIGSIALGSVTMQQGAADIVSLSFTPLVADEPAEIALDPKSFLMATDHVQVPVELAQPVSVIAVP